MPYATVWVHHRHADHPGVPPGLRHLKPDVAQDLLDEGCAQPWHTDQRKLFAISDAPPKMRKVDRSVSGPESPDTPAPQESEPPRDRAPTRPSIRKKRAYKRRDLKPEE